PSREDRHGIPLTNRQGRNLFGQGHSPWSPTTNPGTTPPVPTSGAPLSSTYPAKLNSSRDREVNRCCCGLNDNFHEYNSEQRATERLTGKILGDRFNDPGRPFG
ncbi:MAG TPA: hypothetical protein VIC62_18760, partial [Nakamurella sp.]